MAERKYDRLLGIHTVGIREWREQTNDYNRYEAAPCAALEKFFQAYKMAETDPVVGFGRGRCRVPFCIHHRFHIPVTGIEMNDKTFEEALDNKMRYRQQTKHISAPIHFEYGLAENYEVAMTDNCFYFFNPFSVHIFKKVVQNILHSVREAERA